MKTAKFRFQAHRGDSAFFPENTLVSYRAAIEEGYQIIEMDNKFTSDDVCICLHDDAVNRTCRLPDGSELSAYTPSSRLTLKEIKQLDAGIFMGERFAGTRVPTFTEALDFIKTNSTLTVKLDNVFQQFPQKHFEIFCRDLRSADMEERIAFTCKTLPYLQYLSEAFPRAEMHFDGTLTSDVLSFIDAHLSGRVTLWVPLNNAVTAWCRERKADAAYCRELHRHGDVGLWLLSEEDELRFAVRECEADVIETNGTLKPDALQKI